MRVARCDSAVKNYCNRKVLGKYVVPGGERVADLLNLGSSISALSKG